MSFTMVLCFISWELGVPHVQSPWILISCFTSSFGWFWMVFGCFQSIQDPYDFMVISSYIISLCQGHSLVTMDQAPNRVEHRRWMVRDGHSAISLEFPCRFSRLKTSCVYIVYIYIIIIYIVSACLYRYVHIDIYVYMFTPIHTRIRTYM